MAVRDQSTPRLPLDDLVISMYSVFGLQSLALKVVM